MHTSINYQRITSSKYFYQIILIAVLVLYGLIYFNKVLTPGWMHVGDSPNIIAWFAYQFSSFARGEFPVWDPTKMIGTTSFIEQAILLGPIANIVILASLLLGLNDIVLVYAIWIYILIILYTLGVYFLIFLWTKNRAPACYAAIVTLFSSSVFLSYFQNSYILIIYCVPLILCSLIRYLENFKFKYLLCLLLVIISMLYTYEFVMPLSYLLFFAISGVIFYYKTIKIKYLLKIPASHIVFSILTLTLTTLPQALTYFDMTKGFSLPSLTRVEGNEFKMTKDYKVDYKIKIRRDSENFLTCENCWMGTFTGTYFKPNDRKESSMWAALRYYIGPITLPFIFVALFSLSKKAWCVFSSGILIALLAGYIFPINSILKLPIFKLMHNINNLNHYFLLSLIILSAFGFNYLAQQNTKFNNITFVSTLLFFMMGCLGLPSIFQYFFSGKGSFYFDGNESYIQTLLTLAFLSAAILLILQLLKNKSVSVWQTSVIFLTAVLGFWSNSLIIKQHDFLQGGILDDPNILSVRNRTEHSLQFRFERPPNLELGISTMEGKEINPVLKESPEKVILYSYLSTNYSYFTMRDNSYNHPINNGGFPVPKNFFKFSSVFGSELFLEKKFHFLPRVLISNDENDMGLFLKQPNLLTLLFNKGVAVANATQITQNLGHIKSFDIGSLPDNLNKPFFKVDVLDYKANSVRFNVSLTEPGMFVYTDLWHEDWRLEVDGGLVPMRKVFHTFKGVELGPGTHEVKFIFKSKIGTFLILANIIFFGLIIALITVVVYEKQRLIYR